MTTVGLCSLYLEHSEVAFFVNDEDHLHATIDTERLHLQSVQSNERNYNCYAALFGDPIVMSKFASGQTRSREEMVTRIDEVWTKRWEQKDPYSGFAVFEQTSDAFLGHVMLGHGDEPGEAEVAYLFMKTHWGKGVGTEAVTAVVKDYAPATVAEGYLLDGKPLEKIRATSRQDNPASMKLLSKLGMQKVIEVEQYNAMRQLYSLKLKDIT